MFFHLNSVDNKRNLSPSIESLNLKTDYLSLSLDLSNHSQLTQTPSHSLNLLASTIYRCVDLKKLQTQHLLIV